MPKNRRKNNTVDWVLRGLNNKYSTKFGNLPKTCQSRRKLFKLQHQVMIFSKVMWIQNGKNIFLVTCLDLQTTKKECHLEVEVPILDLQTS